MESRINRIKEQSQNYKRLLEELVRLGTQEDTFVSWVFELQSMINLWSCPQQQLQRFTTKREYEYYVVLRWQVFLESFFVPFFAEYYRYFADLKAVDKNASIFTQIINGANGLYGLILDWSQQESNYPSVPPFTIPIVPLPMDDVHGQALHFVREEIFNQTFDNIRANGLNAVFASFLSCKNLLIIAFQYAKDSLAPAHVASSSRSHRVSKQTSRAGTRDKAQNRDKSSNTPSFAIPGTSQDIKKQKGKSIDVDVNAAVEEFNVHQLEWENNTKKLSHDKGYIQNLDNFCNEELVWIRANPVMNAEHVMVKGRIKNVERCIQEFQTLMLVVHRWNAHRGQAFEMGRRARKYYKTSSRRF